MTTNYPPCGETTIKASHRGPFNKHALSGMTWWVLGHRDQADSTQHREELNSLYTGLYTGLFTSLYHLRFISKNINCLAPIGVEWRFVHKVGISTNTCMTCYMLGACCDLSAPWPGTGPRLLAQQSAWHSPYRRLKLLVSTMACTLYSILSTM